MSVPKPVLREALTEPPIALPVGPAAAAIDSGRPLTISGWLLTALFFLVPLLTYWPATFYDYGLLGDYSNLREAHEEPGTILNFCASHARPIYGWLLQATYGQTNSVQNLRRMRLLASLILGAISLVTFSRLRALGWSFNSSLCVALTVALV